MEVLHRSPHHSLPSPVMYPPTNMPRVFTSSSDIYSCYPFETNTPSRTPTPEGGSRHKQGSMDISSHATTLQSVLRGEIPPAYSHLAHSRMVSSDSPSLIHPPQGQDLHSSRLQPSSSPCPSHHSSVNQSPRPQSNDSYTSHDSSSDMQTEPMDLTCKKRSSRKRTAVSAFSDQGASFSSEVLSSSLPAKLSSFRTSSSSSSETEQFSSLSSKSASSIHNFPPSPGDGNQGEDREFSLLRNLLSVGKHHLSPASGSSSHGGSTPNISERSCDSPASENSFPRTPVTSSTHVTLAKKNLFPVSARVSDYLVKLVRFAKSIPEFSTLSQNDKVTLILNAWSRLMLLYMAESNFEFAVTPTHHNVESSNNDAGPSQEVPTMKFVESVQSLIKKCQQMAVDAKEYEFLRMLVLFNSSEYSLFSNTCT